MSIANILLESKRAKNMAIITSSLLAFCKGYNESLDEITDNGGECTNTTTSIIGHKSWDLIGCPFDYVQSVAGFPMLVGKWNFVNESRGGSEISGTIVYG